MTIHKAKALTIGSLLVAILVSGCSTPIKKTSQLKATPIEINVKNLYMNHLGMTPPEFHASSKLLFKSYFKDYEISFHDDKVNDKESLLSTQPFEVSSDDLIKYGFVDGEFLKGRIVGVSRSILHPHTNKIVTGYGFFLHGWNGKRWLELESNRMYEQSAYNTLQDILSNDVNQNMEVD